MIRIERGHDERLSAAALDGDTVVESDSAPTVTILTPGGDTVTSTATTNDGLVWSAIWPASDDLGVGTVTWSFVVDGLARPQRHSVEVVGGRYFDLPSLRARHGLDNEARYPTQALEEARSWIESLIERFVGVAFVESATTTSVTGAPPPDLTAAAITAAREWVLTNWGDSGIPARARSMNTDQGTVSYSFAGTDHPTGIDSVDAILVGLRAAYRIPGIG